MTYTLGVWELQSKMTTGARNYWSTSFLIDSCVLFTSNISDEKSERYADYGVTKLGQSTFLFGVSFRKSLITGST